MDEPLLRLTIFANHPLTPGEVEAVCDEVTYNYNLYLDLSPFNATLERDELMRPVLNRWRGMRDGTGPLYESMIIYIGLQNATVRRSVQMESRR